MGGRDGGHDDGQSDVTSLFPSQENDGLSYGSVPCQVVSWGLSGRGNLPCPAPILSELAK